MDRGARSTVAPAPKGGRDAPAEVLGGVREAAERAWCMSAEGSVTMISNGSRRTRGGRRFAVAVVVAFVATACSGNTSTAPPAATTSAGPTLPRTTSLPAATSSVAPTSSTLATAIAVPGGCGSIQVYRGGLPAWLREGIQGLLIEDAPYALAGPTPVAGFILAYPLKAGTDAPSKILWVVSTPRNGRPLEIRVNPLGADEPVLRLSRPADSGPGEIYPDGVSVTNSGCWHFNLQWATGNAELDLSDSS